MKTYIYCILGIKEYLSIDELILLFKKKKLLLEEDFSYQRCLKNSLMKQLILIIAYLLNHILIDRSDEAKTISLLELNIYH